VTRNILSRLTCFIEKKNLYWNNQTSRISH